ncbi:unnamed protein product [Paramecium octaurelia]|uniref:Secreted protein n=1 Tax=Paramecium octaurelia TaxID=43137 RepID=A0A8S1W865_PAROT|nr:unnamed protein product [Paramecium octaurelia]
MNWLLKLLLQNIIVLKANSILLTNQLKNRTTLKKKRIIEKSQFIKISEKQSVAGFLKIIQTQINSPSCPYHRTELQVTLTFQLTAQNKTKSKYSNLA